MFDSGLEALLIPIAVFDNGLEASLKPIAVFDNGLPAPIDGAKAGSEAMVFAPSLAFARGFSGSCISGSFSCGWHRTEHSTW